MLDFSRAAVDSSPKAGREGRDEGRVGHRPVPGRPGQDRQQARPDRRGTRHPVALTGVNRNDVTQLIPLIEAVPPIRGKRGRPLQRPRHRYADRGYDRDVYRDRVRRFEITPHIARRGTEHGSGLGVHQWKAQ
jgi:hypothetical protein